MLVIAIWVPLSWLHRGTLAECIENQWWFGLAIVGLTLLPLLGYTAWLVIEKDTNKAGFRSYSLALHGLIFYWVMLSAHMAGSLEWFITGNWAEVMLKLIGGIAAPIMACTDLWFVLDQLVRRFRPSRKAG